MKKFIELWRADYSFAAITLAFALALAQYLWFPVVKPAVPFLSATAFAGWDVLGWGWIIVKMRTQNGGAPSVSVAAYRVMQHVFLFTFAAVLALAHGWQHGAALLTVWITGGCDVLFYFLARLPLPQAWDWVSWVLPLPALYSVADTRVPNWIVLANAGLGMLVAIILVTT